MNATDNPSPIPAKPPARQMSWPLFAFALLALAASLWAALNKAACTPCGQTTTLTAGIPVAWLGVLFYAILTAAAIYPLTRFVQSAFFLAAGIHLVLLAALASLRLPCPLCILTAAAALAGALISLAKRPRNLRLAALLFIAGIALTSIAALAVRQIDRHRTTQLLKDPLTEQMARPVPPGHVRLVIFDREGCPYCEQLESQMLTKLISELGDTLEIERQSAPETMESPTLLIIGKSTQTFSGLPTFEKLHQAVIDLRNK